MDELKQVTTLNKISDRLVKIRQAVARGMFDLEPSQEMFDLLFEISQKITMVQSNLRDLIGYKE